jgi:hypothetical protein
VTGPADRVVVRTHPAAAAGLGGDPARRVAFQPDHRVRTGGWIAPPGRSRSWSPRRPNVIPLLNGNGLDFSGAGLSDLKFLGAPMRRRGPERDPAYRHRRACVATLITPGPGRSQRLTVGSAEYRRTPGATLTCPPRPEA